MTQYGEATHQLSLAVTHATRDGWRVESSLGYQATMVRGKKVNHILHLLLTMFTCGLWALVWILIAANGGEQRMTLTVDPEGNISII